MKEDLKYSCESNVVKYLAGFVVSNATDDVAIGMVENGNREEKVGKGVTGLLDDSCKDFVSDGK